MNFIKEMLQFVFHQGAHAEIIKSNSGAIQHNRYNSVLLMSRSDRSKGKRRKTFPDFPADCFPRAHHANILIKNEFIMHVKVSSQRGGEHKGGVSINDKREPGTIGSRNSWSCSFLVFRFLHCFEGG